MKRIIFQCVGNTLLFTLMGLAFLFPFTDIIQDEYGFSGTVAIFPFLLIAHIILYPIVYKIAAKKLHWGRKANSELSYADEREKTITAESAKTAYKVFVGGLLTVVAAVGGFRFFSLAAGVDISIYAVTVVLLVLLLNVGMVSYCVKWCREYNR